VVRLPAGFWEPLNPGWFLQWEVERQHRACPSARVIVVSPRLGDLCGLVPASQAVSTIVLTTDDAACGLAEFNS
jgi:hypothetical protein